MQSSPINQNCLSIKKKVRQKKTLVSCNRVNNIISLIPGGFLLPLKLYQVNEL